MISSELEALAMTLTQNELKIKEQPESSTNETKIQIIVLPQELETSIHFSHQRRNQTMSFEMKQLPKINLEISLGHGYPSHQPPQITISGFYEKFQETIKETLRSKWDSDQMVLFDYYTYCQQDLTLDIVQQFSNNGFIELNSIQYQQLKEEEYESLKFKLDIQETLCEICYQNLIGQDKFHILMGCLHHFCKTCLGQYATELINRGEISKLICPSFNGCKSQLTEINLRQLDLSEDLIEKVTIFSINQAIDKMDDFGWCPIKECCAPAEINKMKNFGQCTSCHFTFCLTCKEKNHFFKQCPALKIGGDQLDEHKSRFEDETRRHINQITEQMNLYYISQCTKQCPNCKFTIQKMYGCNKMICSRCGIFFCWSCLKQIEGYKHFADFPECQDIDQAEIPNEIQVGENVDLGEEERKIVAKAMVNCIYCPKCREIITKANSINLLECFKCKTNFCFQCGRLTPELKQHYELTNCYYQDQEIKKHSGLNKISNTLLNKNKLYQ